MGRTLGWLHKRQASSWLCLCSSPGKCFLCPPQATRFVSMLTTLPSAGRPRRPFHSRTWCLQADWAPASGRQCSSVPRSPTVRWSTPPCSGPACSELQTWACSWAASWMAPAHLCKQAPSSSSNCDSGLIGNCLAPFLIPSTSQLCFYFF